MTANKKSYLRGHEIEQNGQDWVYCDTGDPTAENYKKRPCGKCGKHYTIEGHDACLGELPGVINACCGHGSDEGYIQFSNGITIRFDNFRVVK